MVVNSISSTDSSHLRKFPGSGASAGLMLALLFSLTTLSAAELSPPRSDYGVVHPKAPPETLEFSFLVGDYEVTLHAWQGEAWTPARPVNGRWNGWYGLGGMAIIDEWYDPEPAIDPDGDRGINVRMHDPAEAAWKMMWISTNGKQVQDLRAKTIDGVLTMWQVHPERPDFKAEFEVLDADHWARVSYVPDSDTGEWVPQFRLAASRIACEG